MPTSIVHIKPCKNLIPAQDFINSIALSSAAYENGNENDTITGDYSLLLYKSQSLDKYLIIDYQNTPATMHVTVQDGHSLTLNTPFQSSLDSNTVKHEFQSLLNSNKEWKFKQSFKFKNYSMGFYNDFVKVFKWDIYNDMNDLLGIKLLIEYDTLANVNDLQSVLKDVLKEGDDSQNNIDAYYDLKNHNEVFLKVLSMVL